MLIEVATEVEVEMEVWYKDSDAAARQRLIDGGMEPLVFSAADKQWLEGMYHDVAWKTAREVVPPESYDKLFELLTK